MTDASLSKIFIQYRGNDGTLVNGTFDNIPTNICGARISVSFPIVEADGIFKVNDTPRFMYDLYVGEVFDIATLLERVNTSYNKTNEGTVIAIKETLKGNMTVVTVSDAAKERIIEYSKLGIRNVVFTSAGVMPLNSYDNAFTTYEEMVAGITKIDIAFSSVYVTVQTNDSLKR